MKVHISSYPDERKLAYKVYMAVKQLLPGARTKYVDGKDGLQHIYFKCSTKEKEH